LAPRRNPRPLTRPPRPTPRPAPPACGALRSLTAGSFNLTRKPPPGFGASLERLTFGGGFANKNLDLLFPLPRLRSLHATVGL
jgi:hypothetical protein